MDDLNSFLLSLSRKARRKKFHILPELSKVMSSILTQRLCFVEQTFVHQLKGFTNPVIESLLTMILPFNSFLKALLTEDVHKKHTKAVLINHFVHVIPELIETEEKWLRFILSHAGKKARNQLNGYLVLDKAITDMCQKYLGESKPNDFSIQEKTQLEIQNINFRFEIWTRRVADERKQMPEVSLLLFKMVKHICLPVMAQLIKGETVNLDAYCGKLNYFEKNWKALCPAALPFNPQKVKMKEGGVIKLDDKSEPDFSEIDKHFSPLEIQSGKQEKGEYSPLSLPIEHLKKEKNHLFQTLVKVKADAYNQVVTPHLKALSQNANIDYVDLFNSLGDMGVSLSTYLSNFFGSSIDSYGDYAVKSSLLADAFVGVIDDPNKGLIFAETLKKVFVEAFEQAGIDASSLKQYPAANLHALLKGFSKETRQQLAFHDLLLLAPLAFFSLSHLKDFPQWMKKHGEQIKSFLFALQIPAISWRKAKIEKIFKEIDSKGSYIENALKKEGGTGLAMKVVESVAGNVVFEKLVGEIFVKINKVTTKYPTEFNEIGKFLEIFGKPFFILGLCKSYGDSNAQQAGAKLELTMQTFFQKLYSFDPSKVQDLSVHIQKSLLCAYTLDKLKMIQYLQEPSFYNVSKEHYLPYYLNNGDYRPFKRDFVEKLGIYYFLKNKENELKSNINPSKEIAEITNELRKRKLDFTKQFKSFDELFSEVKIKLDFKEESDVENFILTNLFNQK